MIGISPLIGAGLLNASVTLWWVPVYVVAGCGEHAATDLEGVDEVLVAHREGRELEPERLVLELEPGCADAEQGTARPR